MGASVADVLSDEVTPAGTALSGTELRGTTSKGGMLNFSTSVGLGHTSICALSMLAVAALTDDNELIKGFLWLLRYLSR